MSSMVLSGDTSGAVTLTVPAVAGTNTVTLPAATGTVMVSGNQPAFSVWLSAHQTPTNGVLTKVALDTVVFDTANCFNTSTNRFTPNVAGYYQINGVLAGYSSNTSLYQCFGYISKNGSTVAQTGIALQASYPVLEINNAISQTVYLNGTTDYIELYGLVVVNTSGSQLILGTSPAYCTLSGGLIRSA